MTSFDAAPTETEASEQLQDEEAVERFADESPAGEPHFEVIEESDPDDSPEQPNGEA